MEATKPSIQKKSAKKEKGDGFLGGLTFGNAKPRGTDASKATKSEQVKVPSSEAVKQEPKKEKDGKGYSAI